MANSESQLIRKIREEETQTLKILEDTKKLKAEENRRVRLARKLEAYKWEQFKKIIEGQEFFRVAHLDALNLPYTIAIHLSAKNAGKTTEIFRMITKVLERGEKFMYGRVQANELERETEEFINREESPVYPIKHNNRWYFYKKSDIMDYQAKTLEELGNGEVICSIPTLNKLRNAGYNYVGKGFSFTAANCLSGGSYEGYNTVIFDEILSYSPINRINDKVLHNWAAALNTIQRNKPNLRVYLFGNLQEEPSNPILEFYGIDPSDTLRYISRQTEKGEPCKILYVNSMGLYLNTIGNKGGASMHAGAEKMAFLKHNRVIKPTGNILTPHIFENMDHELSFAIMGGMNSDIYHVELRKTGNEKDEYNCISCDKLKISTIVKGEIYTSNPLIYNSFNNTTLRYSIESLFNIVYKLFKYKLLYFDRFESLESFKEVLNYNYGLIYENQPNNLCLPK